MRKCFSQTYFKPNGRRYETFLAEKDFLGISLMIVVLKDGGTTPVAIMSLKHPLETEQTDQSIFIQV